MKSIQTILKEMYDETEDLDKQAGWITTYKMDPIQLGRMCEKFPGLMKAWNEFKIIYELCRSQHDIDNETDN